MALRKLCSAKSAFNSYVQHSRQISVSSRYHEKVVASKSEVRPNWDRSIEEAIKCVGYQTPYLSLGYLTNDEDVRWNENMGKLEGSQHPMCETAKWVSLFNFVHEILTSHFPAFDFFFEFCYNEKKMILFKFACY